MGARLPGLDQSHKMLTSYNVIAAGLGQGLDDFVLALWLSANHCVWIHLMVCLLVST